MAMLVDYRCGDCGGLTERWVSHPPPESTGCARCGRPARRRFGGALLTGDGGPDRAVAAGSGPPSSGACGHDAGVPGTCTLVPTAARMLSARARGDNRALDREMAHQERAISAGTLDPSGPLTTTFTGGPLASS